MNYRLLSGGISRMLTVATLKKLRRPTELAVGGYMYCRLMNPILTTNNYIKNTSITEEYQEEPTTFFGRLYERIRMVLRFLQLCILFTPTVILSPLALFKATEDIWYWVFVRSIETAGVVWIKSFQYLSHRHDIIGEKMAMKFMHLREHAPVHPFSETQNTFRKQFGKGIDQVFDKFYDPPMASGSISQVYDAVYRGQRVAVKVRHKDIIKNIKRDVDILFAMSKMLSYISVVFQLPITKSTLTKTLTDQLDFRIQQKNLNKFNELFHWHHNVHFPKVMEEVTGEAVLVQTFVQGKPITYFEKNPHELNKTIARIGAMTFFEMLFKYNFIHADCHGGNIIVKITPRKFTVKDLILDQFYKFYRMIENIAVKLSGQSQIAKELYLQSKQEDDKSREILKRMNLRVDVTLIDAGMVLELDEKDRQNFVNFIRCVVQKEPYECAKMVYTLSLHHGKPIIQNGVLDEKYMNELIKYFVRLSNMNLRDINGLELLKGMLYLVRDYGMKLDGQLGALITNLLILEQIVKDLDPEMNILNCAVPYFYAPQP